MPTPTQTRPDARKALRSHRVDPHRIQPRPRNAWHIGLLAATLLLALAGYWRVEAGSHGRAHGAIAGDARTGTPLHRLAVKVERDMRIDLPEEYEAIRPAGVDGAAPAIPPSETWPAQ